MRVHAQLRIPIGAHAAGAAARSRLYQYFSRAVCYPETQEQWSAIRDAAAGTLGDIAGELPYELILPAAHRGDDAPGDLRALQLSYTRLFEAAGNGCAIPLNESEYAHAARKDIWEDTIRFYEHFGLNYNGALARNWPDHLGTELECLHYLSFLQSGLPAAAAPILRAQADFIERHLLNWLPDVVDRVRAAGDSEPYAGIMAALLQFLEADQRHLRAALDG